MITGHVPFDGDSTVTVALKHLQEEIKSPAEEVPDIPYSLECIIMKCTQKNPAMRYQSCDELLQDLKHSLVDPEGDFVVLGGRRRSDRTVVMSPEEVERLQRERGYDEDDEYDEDFIKLGGNYFEIVPSMKVREALSRIGHPLPTLAEQKKTLDAWLRSNLAGEPKEDEGFTYGRLAVMAGPVEDGALKSVIIRLCDDEDEAKEEIDK